MTRSVRVSAALLLVGALAACGGQTAAPLLPQNATPQHATTGTPTQAMRRAIPEVTAFDIGRRAPQSSVDAVVLLRYNHQAELDRFVDALTSAARPRYLMREEFAQRYAMTQQQQRSAIDELQSHGITVSRTFPNRTLLDVSAPSATFEKYFATEIHDFDQGKYGRRYAPVAPIRIPDRLKPYAAAVIATTVVSLHSDLIIAPPQFTRRPVDDNLPAIVPPHRIAEEDAAPDAATNMVRNPGFETGHLKPWTTCDASTTNDKASVQKIHPHGGRFDAYAGTYQNEPEPNGLTSVCEALTIPQGAALTAYSWGISNDKGVRQFGAIYDYASGNLIKTLWSVNKNNKSWQVHRMNLSAYAGDKVYLAFGVIGKATHTNKTVGQLVDDVSLTGTRATPPPPALPCPTPKTNPTPTPSFASNDGWGPQSVQDGLCMPVNYGYDGTGQTAGIVIDKEVNATDLSNYLSAFGITRTGSLSYSLIDGAPAATDNEGEATLDIETIAALAPGAKIVVYVTGDLNDQHIADAYNTAVTDGNHAAVVNSSFGGCESPGAGGFDQTVNSIAQQAASQGITFSASSGDQGPDCYNGNPLKYAFGVQGPASAPYFVGVGGTQTTVPFYTSYDVCSSGSAVPATITNPQVWSDCVGAGGGGISKEWHLPAYQANLGLSSFRNVPDIGLPAVEDAFCYSGGSGGGCIELGGLWFGQSMIWGTSWSSPIYVAMQTEINEACGGPQWGIATIYNGYAKSNYRHFIDVNKGNNQYLSPKDGSGGQHYNAGYGFDQVSGIGTPLGMFLAEDRCGALPKAAHR